MGDFESYEIVIKPQKDAKNKLMRAFLILFYAAFVVGCLILGFVTAFVPLLALVPLVLWIIIFFTWRFVNVEYEYAMESGVITFTKIYNNRTRKMVLAFDIRSAEYIVSATDADLQMRIVDYDPRREYFFAASKNDISAYTALFQDDDGDKCAVTFVADERIKRQLKMYNAAALRK